MTKNSRVVKELLETMHIRLVNTNQSTDKIERLYNEVMSDYENAVLNELDDNLKEKSNSARKEFEEEECDV